MFLTLPGVSNININTDNSPLGNANCNSNRTTTNTVLRKLQVGEKVTTDVKNKSIKHYIGNGGVVRLTTQSSKGKGGAIQCSKETISRILKPLTFLEDDVVDYASCLFRKQFDANISDTLFCRSLSNHGWWHGHKYFDFKPCKQQTSKPSVYAKKLIIPIFKRDHWMLCVRYDTSMSDTECSDWQFTYLDSLNSDVDYRWTMNLLTEKSSLHWKKGLLSEKNIKELQESPDSYTQTMIRVPQQTEVECGSRLIVHMLLALVTNSPSDLKQRIFQLGCVPNLSQRCRQWVHDIVSHRIPLGQLPLWFPSTTISPLDRDICGECLGMKYSLSIKLCL